MPITAMNMIQDALEMGAWYSPGETVTDADFERSLGVLNKMMDSWSNESLTCYVILQQSTPLVVNKQFYTIGTSGGADINLPRPLKLLDGPGTCYIIDTNGNRYGVSVEPLDKWNLIGNPQANSNIPNTVNYEPQYPLGLIKVFPIPNESFTLWWNSYMPLGEFANLASPLNLPPGYEDAIVSNLCVRLKPYFGSATVPLDPIIVDLARVSKANVKRTNIRVDEAVFDPEIISRASYTYNINTDRGGGLV